MHNSRASTRRGCASATTGYVLLIQMDMLFKCEVRGCSGTIRSVTCRPAGAAPAELQRTSSQGGKPCGSEARTDGGDQLRAPPRSLVKRSPVSPRRCTAAPRPGRPAAVLRPHCAAAAAHQGACHLHPASWPRPSPLHWHNGGLGKAGMLESRSTVASSPAHRSVPLSPLITNRERQLAVQARPRRLEPSCCAVLGARQRGRYGSSPGPHTHPQEEASCASAWVRAHRSHRRAPLLQAPAALKAHSARSQVVCPHRGVGAPARAAASAKECAPPGALAAPLLVAAAC